MATEPRSSQGDWVVIDGSGEAYEVCAFDATFTLRSLTTGSYVQIGSATLRQLGIEWNGRTLKEVGGA